MYELHNMTYAMSEILRRLLDLHLKLTLHNTKMNSKVHGNDLKF